MDEKRYLVKPGSKIKMSDFNPDDTDGYADKAAAKKRIAENQKKIADLQYKLYSESRQSLLIVLQAMDAGGKDGTIKNVLAAMNPQSCRVFSFKTPNPVEASHDFLWRIHHNAPRRGEVAIFNRSHYEDVLVVRVHDLVAKEVWSQRFDLINDFEKLLASNDTKIVKFFLNISKEEQLKRFLSRLDDKNKTWKISDNDYKERQYWDKYMEAFEDALGKCSKPHAPWYVIPSNHKWFRDLVISEILVRTLESMHMKLPQPSVDLQVVKELAEHELCNCGNKKLIEQELPKLNGEVAIAADKAAKKPKAEKPAKTVAKTAKKPAAKKTASAK